MSTKQFPEFYRLHGMIRLNNLPDPEPVLIKSLPIDSALHYLGNDDNPQIDVSDPLMLGYTERVRYMNITQYPPTAVGGRRMVLDLNTTTAKFDKLNRGFKVAKNFADLKVVTSKQLMVFNYGYLDEVYRWPKQATTRFLQFESKLATLVDTINRVQEDNPRNHFIVLDVPNNLLPKTILDNNVTKPDLKLANIFTGPDEQILRHFWMLLDPALSARSIWSKFSDDTKKKVNFIYKSYDGKYTVINLGYLFSWVRGNPNLTFMKMVDTKNSTEVQKYFLRGNIVMQTIDQTGSSMKAQEDAQREKAKLAEEQAKLDEEASEKDERFLQDQEYEASALRDQSKLEYASKLIGDDGARTSPEVQAINRKMIQDQELQVDPEVNEEEVDGDLAALEKIYIQRIKAISVKPKDAEVTEIKSSSIEDVIPEDAYTSEIPESTEQIKAEIFTSVSPEQALLKKLEKMVDEGRITATEYRKKAAMIKQSSAQPDPYGSGKTIAEASVVTKEELQVTKKESALSVPATVIDKSMGHASLSVMAQKYNGKTLHKDILSCIQAAQKGGVIIKSHMVDIKPSIMGDTEVHTIEITPLNGQPSIVRAMLPIANEDGEFTVRGSKYVMRRGVVDLPIRKIGPNRVGLSSYYGKTFIDRAVRKADSSLEFVLTRLGKGTISPDEYLRDVTPGDVFDNYFESPYFYSGISERFKSFKAGDVTFDFNHKGFRKTLDPKIVNLLEVDGTRICGWIAGSKKAIVTIDKDSYFYANRQGQKELLGDIYDILKLNRQSAPVDFAEVKIFSQGIPVGVYLGKLIGFRKLIKLLQAKHRIVEGRQQKNLETYEYVIQFRDLAYIFDRRDSVNSLIIAGFQAFSKETRLYDAKLFDSQDVYLRLLETKGLSSIYLIEMENMQDMFIDPITERVLKEMGEPSTFNELLIRACELLQTYYYPSSQDANYQRIRGYERFAGFFYKDLVQAIRGFKAKNRTGRAKVDISPYQVWSTVTRDSSVKHAEDINPIQSLKISQEAVTYVGEGGRGKESMNRASRAYVESNLGVLSEASVDSSDVGINAFLSADPGFATTDGVSKKDRPMQAANLMSTSVLLAPYAENDDMKRRGFISIQQGHTIATEGYGAPMIRTGYESVVGMRTSETFAKTAKMAGVVTSVSDKGITVKFEDGSEQGYPLGLLYGKAEGSVYPHTLTTDMKVGQKFKKDEYLTYNTKFFEKDPILPGGIVYKGSLMARVVLMEVPQTHEDSSTISASLSKRLMTTTVKPKTYTVGFKQNILNVVKVGQKVKPEDVLMTIEDEITASDDSFRDSSLAILSERSKNSPKAGYVGIVSGVEVFYHGDLEDMSSSLKSLAQRSNREKAEEAKSRLKTASTGFVTSDFSVDGNPLSLGKAVIRIYINVMDEASVGDKVVFSHQLKSVIGEVMPYTLRTESGDLIDAKMGAKSFANRIVESIVKIGEKATVLDVVAKEAVKRYRA